MNVKLHEKYIKRCIQLAENGLGRTYPNPMVGSVVVCGNRIIGEGWHKKAGGPHAEVNAINSVRDKSLLSKASIFVSLEPCSHFGKTPPCSDLIIANDIKKVVIGTVDPFPAVAGRGIKKLLDAGCEVVVGVLEDECRELNKRFFSFHGKKRPYIILKWAQSQDGFIAPADREERAPMWISNRYSKQLVHKWRSEEQGILVGTTTAVADDPRLDTRLWTGRNPVRVALDRQGRIPKSSNLFNGSTKTLIITEKEGNPLATPLQQAGTEGISNLIFAEIDFRGEVASQICDVLYRHEVQSVIVEGGTQTLQTFIDAGLWDEARIFTGTSRLGQGVAAPEFSGTLISEESIGTDTLKIYQA